MKKIILMLIVLTFTLTLFSVIMYVPDFGTIQEAMDASTSGDEIIVRDGTYQEEMLMLTPNLDPPYTRNITLRSEHNDPTTCIIKAGTEWEYGVLSIDTHQYSVFDRTTIKGFTFTCDETTFDADGIFIGDTHVDFIDCVIRDNGLSGIINTDDISGTITNCTIVSNGDYGIVGENFTIVNTIIYNNTDDDIASENNTVTYSCIEDDFTGNGNIDEDPIFETVGDNDYCLTWDSDDFSPCINTGYPFSPEDPDGSRADMGAYYKDHEIKRYNFPDDSGITWFCFDILDPYNASTNNQVQYLFESIKYDLIEGEHEDILFSWDEVLGWENGEELIITPNGYVFTTDECQLEIEGFRIPKSTTFDLFEVDENWIGYFVNKTQHVYDAFDDYLEVVTQITHQDWSIKSTSGEWPDVPYTLSLGDMVKVECNDDIDGFSWIGQQESEKFIVSEPQSFSYTEESDYIPIYIDLDPEDMPEEIGVLLDDECKGAAVVLGPLANICAYITESQVGSLEFEFSYGSRGMNKNYNEYVVYDPETGYRETTTIDLKDKQDYYYVSFRSPTGNQSDNLSVKLSASNYPNPFNPTTTISYDLPSDGKIELVIYNMKGQKVKELVNGTQPAGNYSISWNGQDKTGKQVSSGIYFYRITTSEKTLKKKMLLLK